MTREEAINAITAFVENYACGNDLVGLKTAIEALKERPHGEWIRKMYDGWECSSCHKMQYTMDIESYHYCRFCGSRMVGDADG